MITYFINPVKKIWNTPILVVKPSENISSGLKLLLIFGFFYFAIFQFNASLERIIRDLFEFFSVGFSLFCSWLIFWFITDRYLERTKKGLTPTVGLGSLAFLVVYTMMIGIHFLNREFMYGSEKSWVWAYYWRHFPYAVLIACVYFYRENKHAVIENMVKQLNLKLESSNREEIKHKDTGENEALIHLPVDGGIRTLTLSYISHISVAGHYLDIYYQKKETPEHLLVRKSLTEIFEELPSPPFLKIHRSHIVNLNYISEMEKMKRQYQVLVCDRQFSLPISRNNLSNFLSNFEQTS